VQRIISGRMLSDRGGYQTCPLPHKACLLILLLPASLHGAKEYLEGRSGLVILARLF